MGEEVNGRVNGLDDRMDQGLGLEEGKYHELVDLLEGDVFSGPIDNVSLHGPNKMTGVDEVNLLSKSFGICQLTI